MNKLTYTKFELFYIVGERHEILGPFTKAGTHNGIVTVKMQPSGTEFYFQEWQQVFEHWSDAAEHVAQRLDKVAATALAKAQNLRTLAKAHGPR